MEYYDQAKDCFARSRALRNNRDEHAYFTEIDMISYRINNVSATNRTNALLRAEQHALTFEALRVVPFDRQNLLRNLIGREIPFTELSGRDKKLAIDEIMDGRSSPLLLEYYAQSLLLVRDAKSWQQLSKLVSLYWPSAQTDPATATVIGLIAKNAFIKNAESRFELLRGFYDKLIRYQEARINFVLLAEYVRLIWTDALVLEKYDFLRATIGDIIEVFRESKPTFLNEEFILDKKYYCFNDGDSQLLVELFKDKNTSFSSRQHARRYQKLVNMNYYEGLKFFNIELDPISRYYIKGVRKEVAGRGNMELNFCIKHVYDGFLAADFRV
jgi:hypothetical protein